MRIFLQIPEGLKKKALKIADEFEDVLISGEACYGACDLRINEAKQLGCDKIVHYGHSEFMKTDIPVEYREMKERIDVIQILENNLNVIRDNKIGLITSLQFIDSLEDVKRFLESKGKTVYIYKNGQILGCDITAAKAIEENVDCFLSIGSGKFHPLGLALETEKPLFVLDVERKTIEPIDNLKEKFMKQKYVAQSNAKDAKVFGILVSTKPGQINIQLAEKIKKDLINKGKKAYILVFDEIKPEKLEGIDVDAYINTACPRIAIENRTLFKKPILNPNEIEIFK